MKLNIRIINFCNFMSYLIVKISDKNIAFYVGIVRLHFKRHIIKRRHIIKTYNNKQLLRFLNTRFFIVNILSKNISINFNRQLYTWYCNSRPVCNVLSSIPVVNKILKQYSISQFYDLSHSHGMCSAKWYNLM